MVLQAITIRSGAWAVINSPIIGTTTRQTQGYPINGYWQRPSTWADKNGDGIITPDEVTIESTGGPLNDGFQFIGYSQPRHTIAEIKQIVAPGSKISPEVFRNMIAELRVPHLRRKRGRGSPSYGRNRRAG